MLFKIAQPTLISSTGSAANDTRKVSPIPCFKSQLIPIDDNTVPPVKPPASVIPRCNGASVFLASSSYAVTHKLSSDAFTEKA